MGYIIITPENSFVRFDGENSVDHCIHGEFKQCLPVYAESDIAFQFVIEADTAEQADALCLPGESGIAMGIVLACEQEGFTAEFDEMPERYRISERQVLYNWPHGLPGMIGNVEPGECFYVRLIVLTDQATACSSCFQRIADDCFTSVLEYGNEENFGGFNYCNAGEVSSGSENPVDCEPEVYQFNNLANITIPYIASLQARFGTVPTVQVWIYNDSGELVNMGVVATFDAMPPTQISVDFGGISSGIIVIR